MNKAVLVTQLYPTLCYPMDVVHQAPLSMKFSRQEYWSINQNHSIHPWQSLSVCASVSALHPLSSEIRPWQLRPTEGEAGKAAQLHKGPRLSRWGITPPEWRTPSQALEAALCVGRDPSSSARGGSGELESWRKPWDPGAPAVPAHSLLLGGAPAFPALIAAQANLDWQRRKPLTGLGCVQTSSDFLSANCLTVNANACK